MYSFYKDKVEKFMGIFERESFLKYNYKLPSFLFKMVNKYNGDDNNIIGIAIFPMRLDSNNTENINENIFILVEANDNYDVE